MDRDGITTFWVMRSLKHEGLTPAHSPIKKELGNTFANLVAGEGAELAKWLLSSGIVQESGPEKSLDVEKLRYYFKAHCAVLEGHQKLAGHDIDEKLEVRLHLEYVLAQNFLCTVIVNTCCLCGR